MSTREIEKSIGTPRNTINRYIQKSYKEYGDEIGTNPLNSEGRRYDAQMLYVGNAKDLDYINSKVNQGMCGGGRRKPRYTMDNQD